MRPPKMNRPSLLKSTAIFLAAYLILLMLSMQYGQHFVELFLPLYRWEIGWLAPGYRILGLALQDNHGEAVVALSLELKTYIVFAGRVLQPGGGVSSSTLAGHILQDAVVMLSLLAAWPARRFYERPLLWVMALPFLLLIEMLDTPLMLLGSIEDILLANIAPGSSSFLVYWIHFLDGGGRLALSIAAALAAAGCDRMLAARPQRVRGAK